MGEFADYRGQGDPACPGVGVDKESLEGHTLAWAGSREESCEVVGLVDKVGNLSGAWALLVLVGDRDAPATGNRSSQ